MCSGEAVGAYQRALDLKPNYMRAWANMGISQVRARRAARAANPSPRQACAQNDALHAAVPNDVLGGSSLALAQAVHAVTALARPAVRAVCCTLMGTCVVFATGQNPAQRPCEVYLRSVSTRVSVFILLR